MSQALCNEARELEPSLMLLVRSLGSFPFEWPVMARAICNEARGLAITGYWLVPVGSFPRLVPSRVASDGSSHLQRGKSASHHWLLARCRWLVPFWTVLFWHVPFWLVPIGSFPSVVVRWVRWVVLWVVMAVKSMALMMAAGRMLSEGVGE